MNSEIKTEMFQAGMWQAVGEKQITLDCTLKVDEGEKLISLLVAKAVPVIGYVEGVKGEARFGGRVDFCALYTAENGALGRAEDTVEFQNTLENSLISPQSIVESSVSVVELTMTHVSEESVTVTVIIEVKLYAENSVACETLSKECDNLIVKREQAECLALSAKGLQGFTLESDLEVKARIESPYLAEGAVELSSVTAGADMVTLEGNIYVTITYFDKTKELLACITQTVPFREEVEASGCAYTDRTRAHINLMNFALTSAPDQDKDESVLNLRCELTACVRCYHVVEIDIAIDAFSPTHILHTEVVGQPYTKFMQTTRWIEKIEGSSQLEEDMHEIYRVLGVAGVSCSLSNVTAGIETRMVEGMIRCSVLYDDAEGRKNAALVEIPYSVATPLLLETGDLLPSVCVTEIYARTRNGRDVDVYATLSLSADCFEKNVLTSLVAVENISEFEIGCPLRVYFASVGESRWNVCKELHCTVEQLLAQNREVDEVFTKEERILLYRQA